MTPAWLPGVLAGVLSAVIVAVSSLLLASMNNRHQRRLEMDRASAAKDLEVARADIAAKAKAAEKRATVAADALLASLELLDGMEAAASVARIIGDPDEEPDEDARERARRKVAARWEWLRQYDDQFDRAYKLAQVYLPDAVHDALERVRKLKWSTHVDRLTHAETIAMEHRRDAEKFFEGGYGKVPEKQISDLRDELKGLLRPLAQLSNT